MLDRQCQVCLQLYLGRRYGLACWTHHIQGEFLAYTSKHAAASIRVTKGGKVVIDGDYGARKTLLIDDDVIHLPEGMGREI